MNLRPIRKKRLSESAIDEIKNFIFSNDLQEGDQLPSERVLVQKLQISRSSIREALRMLEITGLIEVKPGKGIFVRHLAGDIFSPLSSWISNNKTAIYKHFEVRLILEPDIAALAARRISPRNVQRLEENIDRQMSYPETDIVSIIRADIDFHRLVAESSENETIIMLMDSLSKISFQGWKAALRVEGRNATACREHRELVSLIAARDEKGARKAMREHMMVSIDLLKQKGFDFS